MTLQPDVRARVTVEASVSPSEDPSKVASALEGAIGGEPGGAVLKAGSARLSTNNPKALAKVRDALRDRHVRAAARRHLLLHRKGRSSTLMLNRQAAAAGVLALCGSPEESPLGPVYMTIESEDLDRVLDWLTAYEGG